jgi:hypothetical protein
MSRRWVGRVAAFGAGAWLAACSSISLPPATGLMDVLQRPGEAALLAGLRAYEEGQYEESEKQMQLALRNGLTSPADRAAAYKHLAFIACASQRIAQCEQAFRSARNADRSFSLTRSEAGHPIWGPVYRKLFP